jgi:quinol-cytochrome oxidoreductase complex cytochrome b subunit
VDVPVQFFQSVIGIEIAVIGALLFQIRYFDRDDTRQSEQATDPRILVVFALVLFATIFGSLWGIAHHGQRTAASLVTAGVAISVLPILLRSFPQLRRADLSIASRVVGVVAYVAFVTGLVVLVNE